MPGIRKLIRSVWNLLPRRLRQLAVRVSQTKFTASAAAIVHNEKGEVLLLKHVLRPASGWGIPGGFLERNEQPENAIKRELKEETGLDIENVRQIRTRTLPWRHLEVIFSASASGEPKVNALEISDAGWFRIDSLPEGIPYDHQQLLGEVLKR